MTQKISTALLSVFYKDGLEPLVRQLAAQGVTIYSTGGTQAFIESMGVAVVPVEKLTAYPSILGGRVKTLHPLLFGGILGRRNNETDLQEMEQWDIPQIDLVVVDLYPFQETVDRLHQGSDGADKNDVEAQIIEKIDIGGPSMIRAAAKNHSHVAVVASKNDYAPFVSLLQAQNGGLTQEQRKAFAAKAFSIVAQYDNAISDYFNTDSLLPQKTLRYGENPHQGATFYGKLEDVFEQLHGKEISYNNLVDIDAALALMNEFDTTTHEADEWLKDDGPIFAIIKHTNVCGIAQRATPYEAWQAALAADKESAFGGVLVCNKAIDLQTANAINEIFFEVLIAPSFDADAMVILQSKKNRILLVRKETAEPTVIYKSVLNGRLVQDTDRGNTETWKEEGGRKSTPGEKKDLLFANIVSKHLKSNAIALVKNRQMIGKGCGQTSRIDALRQALEKAAQFGFDLHGSVMASDAFFPFGDCVQLGHQAGITAFIQPGGSIRDTESITYCKEHNLVMVLTGMRHFRH